jgi:uncharacterized membrane-anchored protein
MRTPSVRREGNAVPIRVLLAALLVVASVPSARAAAGPDQQTTPPAAPAEPKLSWVSGPGKVELGSEGEVSLPESMAFLGSDDARKRLESWGNVTSSDVRGLIEPKSEQDTWAIVFVYDDTGYIKGADKEEIDADELLASLKKGSERANEERKKRGFAVLHLIGWKEPPRYDPATHNLTWATLNRAEKGGEVVNYNVRILGRSGVMSIKLVDDPAKIASAMPAFHQVISAFSFKQGKTYAEWVKGDKVAEYGLAGLVAAGAGAAAFKLGFFGVLAKLFAKFAKIVLVALVALGTAIAKGWRSFLGLFKKKRGNPSTGDFRAPPGPGQVP